MKKSAWRANRRFKFFLFVCYRMTNKVVWKVLSNGILTNGVLINGNSKVQPFVEPCNKKVVWKKKNSR